VKLDQRMERLLDRQPADVAWSRVAAVLAINRLRAPGSELAVEQHLKQRRGELFDAEFEVVLYDVTSIYGEGVAARELSEDSRRGRSQAGGDSRGRRNLRALPYYGA